MQLKKQVEERDNRMKTIYIGFMRLITLNFKLWGKPTKEGWKRV